MKIAKIKAISREEAAKADRLICIRVADAHFIVPGSHQEDCSVCGEKVWVSSSSPAGPLRTCIQCGKELMRDKH